MSKGAAGAGAAAKSGSGSGSGSANLWTSPWLYIGGAVVVGVGIGLSVWAYKNDKKQEKFDSEFRIVLKEVEETFDASRADILSHIADCKWNRLTAAELSSAYTNFSALLDAKGKSRGILSRAAFEQLMRRLGVGDDMVLASLYRVWDANGDGHIDFVEFIRNLNDTVYGPLHTRLQRYFRVYDLDGNGFISRDELQKLFAVFVPQIDAATRNALVSSHFTAMDSNADRRISFAEFEAFCHDPLRGGLTSPSHSAGAGAGAGAAAAGAGGGASEGLTFAQRLQSGFERQLLAAFGVHHPAAAIAAPKDAAAKAK